MNPLTHTLQARFKRFTTLHKRVLSHGAILIFLASIALTPMIPNSAHGQSLQPAINLETALMEHPEPRPNRDRERPIPRRPKKCKRKPYGVSGLYTTGNASHFWADAETSFLLEDFSPTMRGCH